MWKGIQQKFIRQQLLVVNGIPPLVATSQYIPTNLNISSKLTGLSFHNTATATTTATATATAIATASTSNDPSDNNVTTGIEWKQERPRRCLFSVPGFVPKMIHKAQTLNADAVVLDLEDGVPLVQKDNARKLVYDTLKDDSINFGRSEVCVRINSLGTGEVALRDLETIIQCTKLQTIVIPKVESAEDLHFVNSIIDSLSPTPNCDTIRILAAIESAMGMLNLREIASWSSSSSKTGQQNKLDGLIFASEDYCADIEAIRTSAGTELLFARSLIVTTAKAYNLQAIDMVHINFRDNEALQRECQTGKELGFTGKQAIHPLQIEPIHTAYSPSTKDIIFANQCVQLFHGTPIDINGIVVDVPVYKWAIKLLRRAEAAGIDIPTTTTATSTAEATSTTTEPQPVQ